MRVLSSFFFDSDIKHLFFRCGLYYKLHGSARPISMKSDVIRKRSRHDARRGSNAGATGTSGSGNGNNNNGAGIEDKSSASPGVSRRASPAREPSSPTLAPDSTTTLSYDYNPDHLGGDAFGTQSELVGALGGMGGVIGIGGGSSPDHHSGGGSLFQNTFQFQFPGPYHPDYLLQMYSAHAQTVSSMSTGSGSGNDGLTGFGSPSVGVVDISSPSSSSSPGSCSSGSNGSSGLEMDLSHMSPRSPKRRRMSTDSASEPPSSAVSFSSFSDGYSPTSSTTSLSSRSPMEYPFASYSSAMGGGGVGSGGASRNGGAAGVGGGGNGGPALRGSGNTFWHPPMMPQNDDPHTSSSSSPHLGFLHQPMLPPLKNMVSSRDMSSSSSANANSSSTDSSSSPDHNEDSPMDYLHPGGGMGLGGVGPDDDSLFSAYLHPPMGLQEDSPAGSSIVT